MLWVRVLNWTLANRMICVFWKISENMTFLLAGRLLRLSSNRDENYWYNWIKLFFYFSTFSFPQTSLTTLVNTDFGTTVSLCYVKNYSFVYSIFYLSSNFYYFICLKMAYTAGYDVRTPQTAKTVEKWKL